MKTAFVVFEHIIEVATRPLAPLPPINTLELPRDERIRRKLLGQMAQRDVLCVRGRVDQPEEIKVVDLFE